MNEDKYPYNVAALSAFSSGFTGNNLNIFVRGKSMTEIDWAKSIAIDLAGAETSTNEIAAALRKAKADGMMEAAEIVGMAAEEFRERLGGESEDTLHAMENIAVVFDKIKQTIEVAAQHLHPPT